MKNKIISWIIFLFYRTLMATWRIRVHSCESYLQLHAQEAPTILAHFHGDELALLHLVKKYKLCTMTSTSKDGGYINFVIHQLGGKTSRGSSTRGGVSALKGLIRLIKTGHPASIAIDGPKGPLHKVKPGVFEISRLAQAPIFTLTAAASRKIVFEKAWNKTFLPLPFARIAIEIKEALPALSRSDDPRDPNLSKRLENLLFDSKGQVSKLIAE